MSWSWAIEIKCKIHSPIYKFQISEDFEEVAVQSRGFGILDVGYRSRDEAWAAGGSGILLRSNNGGKTWNRDKEADNIAANLYSVK